VISPILNHTQIDREKWQLFVENHDQGTIFHTPYIYDIYKNTPDHEPFALFVVDEHDQIQAMLAGFIQTVKPGILSFLSRRAVLMQSPIYNSPEDMQKLLKGLLEVIKRKVVYAEIRNHYCSGHNDKIYRDLGFKFEDHLNIIVDLTKSEDDLWKEVHSKRRNEIRKAIKEGLIFNDITKENIGSFYLILDEVYKRARLPLLPKVFFENAINSSNKDIGMRCFGAYYNDELVGCMLALYYKKVIFDMFAGSLSIHYTKNPNDLIPWEVFKWGRSNGFATFDFGGAGKPSVPYGVRDYKLKFGGELVNYGRYYFIQSQLIMKIAETGFKLLKKLKG
jgi:lipid II:glycine glycyltransferase (peptidoglycan interpeptide bridge formation enzyme)